VDLVIKNAVIAGDEGKPLADIGILDCQSRREAVCCIAPLLYSFKRGRTITRNLGIELCRPAT